MDSSNLDTAIPNSKNVLGFSKLNCVQTLFRLESNSLIDLISSRYHSRDFTQKRSDYIRRRLWIMCFFFAVTVPLFSVFDFITLPYQHANLLFFARLILSISLFCMAYLVKRSSSVSLIKYIVACAFLLPSLFYLVVMMTFDTIQETPLIFSMMVYLIIAMIGLFPLTIRGGLILISLIFLPFIFVQWSFLNDDYWALFNAIWLFALFSGISLWLQIAQLSMLMHLYRESTIDPLTKLINRRVLLRTLAQLKQHKTSFCVVMFDLDRFKRINDTYGHLAGDKVLKSAAFTIKQSLSQDELIARYGGEEFVAVFPNHSLEQTVEKAKAIAQSLREKIIHLNEDATISVTSSIGVTQHRHNEEIEHTFKRVDDLLYDAKEQGRDRVIAK